MYHLLVSFKGWSELTGSIPTGRIYLDSDESSEFCFYSKGRLDVSKISTTPALLVSESGGVEPRLARIAYIHKITQTGKDTTIQYATDGSFHPIPTSALLPYCSALGTTKESLSHTHWEAIDVDLFKVLLMLQQRRVASPKVFSLDALDDLSPDFVSVMMPFSPSFDEVYACIKSAAATAGMKCQRADDFWKNPSIIQDIVDLIAKAGIVVCDCTGRNPNVFYEAGIAHAIGKEVILIAQSEADIPFDLRHLRYLTYLNNGEGRDALAASLEGRLSTLAGH